jgi:hypothetical protein
MVAGVFLLSTPGSAGFTYNPRDLILAFRQPGGASELVVNVGQASNYTGLATGMTVTITNLDTNQLKTAFANLNNLSWSVSGDVRTSGDTNYPVQTIWVAASRVDIDTQTTPWLRQSQFSQGTVGGQISGIGNGAATFGNVNPAGPNNTTSGVVIPSSDPAAYSAYIGENGDFAGTFQGNVENTTPAAFSSSGQSVRADLYELKPGSGVTLNTPGTYVGYFEFHSSGTMSFTTGPSIPTLPNPNITSIARTGNVNTISFTTVSGASYSLHYTNSAGLTASVTNWPVSGPTLTGDGSVMSAQDSATDTDRFYVIRASQ